MKSLVQRVFFILVGVACTYCSLQLYKRLTRVNSLSKTLISYSLRNFCPASEFSPLEISSTFETSETGERPVCHLVKTAECTYAELRYPVGSVTVFQT